MRSTLASFPQEQETAGKNEAQKEKDRIAVAFTSLRLEFEDSFQNFETDERVGERVSEYSDAGI